MSSTLFSLRPIASSVGTEISLSRQTQASSAHVQPSCALRPACEGLKSSSSSSGLSSSHHLLASSASLHLAVGHQIRSVPRHVSPASSPAPAGRRPVVTAVFERFTERAIRSVMLAQKEAKALGRKEVATEHILLGLVGEERSSEGFLGTGVTMERARDAIRELVDDGSLAASVGTDKPASEVPFSWGSKRVFEAALDESRKLKHNFIAPEHLIVALLSVDFDGAGKVLERLRLRPDKIQAEALSRLRGELDKDGRSTASLAGAAAAPAVRGALSSSTSTLSRQGARKEKSALSDFCVDITARALEGRIDPVIGRQKEVERVVQILARRTKNNPILLGEPGVGKTAIAEGLAMRIVENSVPDFLEGKRVMSLDMGLLLAGAKERGELETRVTNLISETIKAGDVILLIDEVHTMVGSGAVSRGGAAGAGLDISNLLKPALARGLLQCIGATTLDEHRKHIEKDRALARRFQPVMVGEPSEDDAVAILLGLRSRYEKHHRCHITKEAVEAAVALSSRYIADRFLPDKAIDLMDEAGSRARIAAFERRKMRQSSVLSKAPGDYWREIRAVQAAHEAELVKQSVGGGLSSFFSSSSPATAPASQASSILGARDEAFSLLPPAVDEDDDVEDGPVIVGPAEIAAVASLWSGIPLQQLTTDEQQQLEGLEDSLRQRVIGQDDAVNAISRAVRRARAGLKDPDRPIAAMMFCGPTGVGKTELTKALADHYFGSESAMIRLDMSEYMERHTVSKLIGSPPGYVGYGDGGKLTEAVRRRPFSLILLDEIEKAHPDVFNLLLQIFEDGRLTDSQGRTVSFKNTLIVMTSNVGSQIIAKGGGHRIGFDLSSVDSADGGPYAVLKETVTEELKGFFRPELLNRIDEIVVFRSLEQNQVRSIVDILLAETVQRLQQRGIRLELTESLISLVCQEGFDRAYGARPLRRAIARLVEDPVASALLLGGYEEGDSALVDVDESGAPVVTRHAWPNPCDEEGRLCLSVMHSSGNPDN